MVLLTGALASIGPPKQKQWGPRGGRWKGKGGSIGKGSIPITRLLIQGALKRTCMSKTRAWAVLLRLSIYFASIYFYISVELEGSKDVF